MKPFRLFSWFNQLSYTQKFLGIGLLFVLALAGFYPMSQDQLLRREQYGVKELEGTYYLRPLQQLLVDVNTYHLLSIQEASGQNLDQQLRSQEIAIESSLAEANDLHDLYAESLLLENELSEIEASWLTLKASVQQNTDEHADEHADEHTDEHADDHADEHTDGHTDEHDHGHENYDRLNTQILRLISRVGDTSFLILDPDLDTYYMMDAVLLKLPEMQGVLNEIYDVFVHADIENEIDVVERLQLVTLGNQVQTILEELQRGMETSWENDTTGEMRSLTEEPLQELETQIQAYLTLIDDQIIVADPIMPQPNLYETKNVVDAHLTSYYDGTSASLEFGAENRIERFTNRLTFAFSIAIVSIALALTVGAILLRNISRPLNELTVAADKFGAGDWEVRVAAKGEDEASRVGQAFNRMAAELQVTQQQMAEQVTSLSQLTKALEASASVSRQLSTILDSDELVVEVVEQLKQTFNYYHTHIYLLDESGENLIMAGGTGEAGAAMLSSGHQVPIGKGLVGRAASTQLTILVPDVSQEEGWLPNSLLPDTKAETAVPIILGDQLAGVLDVQHNVVDGLQQNDVDLLESIAAQVAIALQNARSYQRAQHKADREAQFNEISRKIQSTTDLESALQVAVREVGRILEAKETRIELHTNGKRI